MSQLPFIVLKLHSSMTVAAASEILTAGWLIPLTITSVVVTAASLGGAAWMIARLPQDYFLHNRRQQLRQSHIAIYVLWVAGKNLLGIALIILGIVMLVTPGQGLLTLLLGITLCDFPGKQQLVHAILRRRTVQKSLNWIRRKAGKPPLRFPEKQPAATSQPGPQR